MRAKQPSHLTNHDTAVEILRAAERLFAAQGFRATTVKMITLECGITPGALYLYFRSKDAVLAELIRVAYDELQRLLDAAEARTGEESTPADRLANLVEGFVLYGTNHTTLARVADNEWALLDEGPERAAVADLRRSIRHRFEDVISRGVAAGEFSYVGNNKVRARHECRFLATAILDMCSGVFSWYTPEGSISARELIARYRATALRIVGA